MKPVCRWTWGCMCVLWNIWLHLHKYMCTCLWRKCMRYVYVYTYAHIYVFITHKHMYSLIDIHFHTCRIPDMKYLWNIMYMYCADAICALCAHHTPFCWTWLQYWCPLSRRLRPVGETNSQYWNIQVRRTQPTIELHKEHTKNKQKAGWMPHWRPAPSCFSLQTRDTIFFS